MTAAPVLDGLAGPPAAGPFGTLSAADLGREHSVPRGLVHVRALSEIFLSDAARDGADAFVAGFQLPRTHGLWGDRGGRHHDPVISLEVARQTVFLTLHHFYQVPGNWKFILRRVDFRVEDVEAYADDGVHPPEGLARVRLVSKTETHGHVDASFEGEVLIGDRTATVMSGDITVLSPYNFTLLRAKGRGRRPPDGTDPHGTGLQRLPPALVGRLDTRNVVLYDLDPQPAEPGVHAYGLVVDESHPAFFDHPHDHVTGSLILEFCRQAGIATARRVEDLSAAAQVTGCSMTFAEFAELDSRTECRASVARVTARGDVLVDVGLRQFGEQIATVQLQLSEPPPAPDRAGD
jgi:hypothetical protein